MSDSFEFTLHSPLTQDDWNKISDAELENTISITFQTPSGRQVKYIKCEVLDKIRSKIKDWQTDIHDNEYDAETHDFVFERIYEIIDEYMVEKGVQKEYLKP